MAITAKMVKELREKTGAGMMDCKKALVETKGIMQDAIDFLKKKGLSSAGKKSDRVAAEGIVSIKLSDDNKKATVVEVNAETDFVAKNDKFLTFTNSITNHIFSSNFNTIEDVEASTIDGHKFTDYIASNIATIGENIVVRRFSTLDADDSEIVNGYVHMGGKIGVLVKAKYENSDMKDGVEEFLKQLAMHIAALKPSILSYTEFEPEFVQKETEGMIKSVEKENEERQRLGKPLKNVPEFVSKLQLTDEVMQGVISSIKDELKAEGKPEKIWDKILPGKVDRFIADNTLLDQSQCLLNQFYALDDKLSVQEVIDSKSKELGGKVEIVEFIRFELGDGIEKVEEDFASEVEAQLK
jgi:elongation factor Ts